MKTKIIHENDENFSDELIVAGDKLNKGALVVFPTETVYGLGANALDSEACKKIYFAKGRPSDNPLIVHVSSLTMAENLFENAGEYFYKLALEFWPGPISFILKKHSSVSDIISGGLDTVAVRMPNNKTALKLIEYAGVPIAAPSANISGKPSPTRREHVLNDLDGKVDYIILSDDFPIGVESTVLDLSDEKPVILRPGAISKSMIERALGGLSIKIISDDEIKKQEKSPVKSPGMKYKHYSPSASVFSTSEDMTEKKICDFALKHGVSRNMVKYLSYTDDVIMARDLFADFRQADLEGYKIILVKPADGGELITANLNRLERAMEK